MRRTTLALVLSLSGSLAFAQEAYQSYESGLKALSAGDCAKAVSSLQAAIAKDPKEAAKKRTYGMNFIEYYPHFYLAKALHCAGDKQKALTELEIAEGQGAFKGGELASLKTQLSGAAPTPTKETPQTPATPTVDPKAATAQKALEAGIAAYQRKEWDRASQSLKEAIANEPGNAEAKKYLQLVLKELQKKAQVDGAIAAAQSFFNSKKFVEAKGKADEAIRIDPKNQIALDLSRRAEAEALKSGTPTPDATALAASEVNFGKQYANAGKWQEAVDHYMQASRLDPGNSEIIQALAEAQKAKDKADQAAKAQAELKTARDLMAASNLAEAKKHADQAASLDPSNQDAKRLLADINAALAKPTTPTPTATATPSAKPSATPTAPTASPSQVAAKEKLRDGVRAFYEGNYDDALAKLGQARADLQSVPAFHLYLGASYLSKYLLAGEEDASLKQNAVDEFKRALQLDPQLRPDPKVLSPRIVEAFQSVQ